MSISPALVEEFLSSVVTMKHICLTCRTLAEEFLSSVVTHDTYLSHLQNSCWGVLVVRGNHDVNKDPFGEVSHQSTHGNLHIPGLLSSPLTVRQHHWPSTVLVQRVPQWLVPDLLYTDYSTTREYAHNINTTTRCVPRMVDLYTVCLWFICFCMYEYIIIAWSNLSCRQWFMGWHA